MNYIINPEYRGSICEIRSYRNELMAVGIVSEVGEDYIKVAPKSGRLRLFDVAMDLKVSIINTRIGLMVVIGSSLTSTPTELKVVDLAAVVDHERRTNFRVDADIQATVSKDRDFIRTQTVVIKDISLCGLLIMTSGLFDLADYSWIKIDVDGIPMIMEFRMIRTFEEKGAITKKYGCQMIAANDREADKLCKFIFNLQRKAIKNNVF